MRLSIIFVCLTILLLMIGIELEINFVYFILVGILGFTGYALCLKLAEIAKQIYNIADNAEKTLEKFTKEIEKM